MKTKDLRLSFAVFSAILLFVSCSRQVSRVSPDSKIDLSGRWNDVDSKMVSDEMVGGILSGAWLQDFVDEVGRKPVVVVGEVSNKSHEHIDGGLFIKDLERAFLSTGAVRVVQNSIFREKMRQERAEQQTFAAVETQKKWGAELGADFMLFGTVHSVVDVYGGNLFRARKKVVLYKISLELAHLRTNEKVWIGDKEIKKFVKR